MAPVNAKYKKKMMMLMIRAYVFNYNDDNVHVLFVSEYLSR